MITFERLFCDPDSNDPYENIAWVREDAEILDAKGVPVFSQASVEFPATWSQRARNIVASKYFYGSGEDREHSLKTLIDRVVDTISRQGLNRGFFGGRRVGADEFATYTSQDYSLATTATEKDFRLELKALLVNQYASFNSPVWFNIGVEGVRQQGAACFINRVEDDMNSILELSMAEGQIFKRGSGAGVNLSRLRGEGEPLSGGGTSSGPISFMKGLDAQAGIIKSGGVTRRAAKMVLMDIDHPDIMEFIRCKQLEEAKAQVLIDAGYDPAIDGEAYASVFFQNANHSVRLTDEFMQQRAADVEDEGWGPWYARYRVSGADKQLGSAEHILQEIAATAWACGDPGVQFTDTINQMHTCGGTEPIYASNPCSEFVFLDNTACNLASINVLKYWDGASFDWQKLLHTVDLLITAQDILVGYSDYPTKDIELMTKNTRPLGLGIANLGALLMTMGLPYDSDEGRDFAAAIMAAITGEAYGFSAVLADELEPFALYRKDSNDAHMLSVIRRHKDSAYALSCRLNLRRQRNDRGVWQEAAARVEEVWQIAYRLGKKHGYRNAQVTVIAPTGTIAFMMDCDTTGMEPLLAPTTIKTLVGGGEFVMRAKCFEDGKRLIHDRKLSDREHLTHEQMEEQPLLATALGDNALSPAGHLLMVAALQPFVSGAISKTINMPTDSTIKEVEDIIVQAWKSGVKCVAIYRDESKGSQPIKAAKKKTTMVGVSNIAAEEGDEAWMEEEEIPILAVPADEGATIEKILGETKASGHTRVEVSDVAQDLAVIASAEAAAAYINPLAKLGVADRARILEQQRRSLQSEPGPYRRKLDRTRPSITHKFDIGGHEGYLTVGLYKDGDVAEIFVNMAKEGSTISGLLGQWAMTLSLALQYGVPINVLIEKHSYVRYEPSGFTGNTSVPNAYSITDYIMRWIAANAASFKEGKDLGKVPEQHPTSSSNLFFMSPTSHSRPTPPTSALVTSGNLCPKCNGILMMQGNCHVCPNCGESTGCG